MSYRGRSPPTHGHTAFKVATLLLFTVAVATVNPRTESTKLRIAADDSLKDVTI